MDSLYSSYISDKDSESDMELTNTDENSSEADANCEPVKMDLSEGSSENEMDGKDSKTDKQSSRSSSNTSDKLDGKHKKHDGNSREKYRPTRNDTEKIKDEEKDQKFNDRRDKERRKERDADRRHHDRKHSRRSRSKNSHRSSKSSRRSKSRSRSHSRKSSRSPRSHHRNHHSSSRRHHRHHSPSSHKSTRRSRSRSYDRFTHSRGYEKRGVSKLHALEKMGIELKVPEVSVLSGNMLSAAAAGLTKPQTLTPQLALQKTMEEQVEKVKSATGIALPSYYNPIAVNASKYAEQIQKRRLLWGNKEKVVPEEAPTVDTTPPLPANKGTIWQGATFGGDQGSKVTAKFKRLMGMKENEQDANPDKNTESTPDIIKKQEELFTSMESQYEVARLATHSHRGLGLGFGTFQPR